MILKRLRVCKYILVTLSVLSFFTMWLQNPRKLLQRYTTYMEQPVSHPYPGIWINPPGQLQNRIKLFTKEIENARKKILKEHTQAWSDLVNDSEVVVVDPNFNYYLKNISKHEEVKLIFLAWNGGVNKRTSMEGRSNLVIQTYYQWAADIQLCKYVTDKSLVDKRWAYWPYCVSDKSQLFNPTSLDLIMVNCREWVANLYHKEGVTIMINKPPPYVLYLAILHDAILSEKGSVISGDIKIFPSSCQRKEWQILPKNYHDSPLYHEVLTIAQRWGMMYYHGNIESLPRLAPYLEFIKRNPSIKIHCGELHSDFAIHMLKILEIPEDRIVKGVIRAKIVYMTEGTTCGFVQLPSIQIMSELYRNYIKNKESKKRNTFVLIRRTKGRGFKHAGLIESGIRNLTLKYNLELVIFSDNPVPSLDESMSMFNRAVMVVGPHGAGLFNVIFCEPGTYVIEVVQSIPHVTMCYQRLAYALGLRYYGCIGPGYDKIDVNVQVLLETVDFYLPHAAALN